MKDSVGRGEGAERVGVSVASVPAEGPEAEYVSRPQLEPERVVAERDAVSFLARRVAEMASELRGLSRAVQAATSGLGSGRRARSRGSRVVSGGSCHAQS